MLTRMVLTFIIALPIYANSSSLLKFINESTSYYPTIYQLGDSYIPQISMSVSQDINSFAKKLESSVNGEYDVKIETLPKGNVITLLPTKRTLCDKYQKCNLSFLKSLKYRVKYMKLLSFVNALGTQWASLQDAETLRNAQASFGPADVDLHGQNLTNYIRSAFYIKDQKVITEYAYSTKNSQMLMSELDNDFRKNSTRLGEVDHKEWDNTKTISSIYKHKDGSRFVLIQQANTGSIVQIQTIKNIDKDDFTKILNKNKLIL